ncbi:MAG: DUF6145 family protein [Lachnospiraceae bacterium]
MYEESVVLCGASAYEQKYYLNEQFDGLPSMVKDELKIACVLFTEEIGGIILIEYDADGNLSLKADADEGDLLYDEIGSGLKLKELQQSKRELWEQLELYYRVVFLGEDE